MNLAPGIPGPIDGSEEIIQPTTPVLRNPLEGEVRPAEVVLTSDGKVCTNLAIWKSMHGRWMTSRAIGYTPAELRVTCPAAPHWNTRCDAAPVVTIAEAGSVEAAMGGSAAAANELVRLYEGVFDDDGIQTVEGLGCSTHTLEVAELTPEDEALIGSTPEQLAAVVSQVQGAAA